MEVDGTPRFLRRGTEFPGGTRPAIGAAEPGVDAWASVCVTSDPPGYRHLALWAGDPLTLPVDREPGQVVALPRAGLPTRHAAHRPLERNVVVAPAVDQQGRVDVGGVQSWSRRLSTNRAAST